MERGGRMPLLPITPDELTELALFLNSNAVSENIMSIDVLDGFLTAMLIGPVTIEPGVWLPYVWDITGSGEPYPFSSKVEEVRITGLIIRFMSVLDMLIKSSPEAYIPLLEFNEYEDLADEHKAVRSWVLGFMLAITNNMTEWRPLMSSERMSVMLAPIITIAETEADGRQPDQKEWESCRKSITETVFSVCMFWQRYRRQGNRVAETVRKGVTVGRNAPCPCGSGKKYKKCCGA